ncbi:hypothetical protein JTB14_006138 [Gonioctena quinquepunctata]|nr:hypothetical protein JTB14_006138 [Gonioctena quinquepunctata]
MEGAEKAWENHCANENNLKLYAIAMKNLATNHWERAPKDVTRIIWTYNICTNYFIRDISSFRNKEMDIAKKINLEIPTCPKEFRDKWKLLDVGSCYNPFKKFDCFEVIAIDIAPAVDEVIECDFLGLEVGKVSCHKNKSLIKLAESSFDIIVFSLFLEYLPCPVQRKNCCAKAYDLLNTEGILIIITPDSNHVGANAKIIKSWQFVLAEIGFSRIKYEKLSHVHCMAFRKSFSKELPQRWTVLHRKKQVYDQIHIPQDFNNEPNPEVEGKCINECLTTDEILKFSEELPFCNISN